MNIYIGNLARSVNDQELRELFEGKGRVKSVKVMTDNFTGEPRGFAFVEMENAEEGQQAIDALNGHMLGGRALVVNEARPRQERPRDGSRRPSGNYGNRSFGGSSSNGGGYGDRGGQGRRQGGNDSWGRKPRNNF